MMRENFFVCAHENPKVVFFFAFCERNMIDQSQKNARTMEQKYVVGTGDAIITLEVTVGTVGSAYCNFSIFKGAVSSGAIAESLPPDGSIPEEPLGTANEVGGGCVIIRTLINFGHLPVEVRKMAVERIVAEYHFEGGVMGPQSFAFNPETDLVVTPNYTIASITSKIELI